jgi:hypothetical protein
MAAEFRRAKVFRRTGCSSFAVQLADEALPPASSEDGPPSFLPGIILVHCTEVDWGYLARRDPDLLEKRLCKMGTPASLFVAGAEDSFQSQGTSVILVGEGVSVALGRYDARLKGFVQCRLKVPQCEPPSNDMQLPQASGTEIIMGRGEIAVTRGRRLEKRQDDKIHVDVRRGCEDEHGQGDGRKRARSCDDDSGKRDGSKRTKGCEDENEKSDDGKRGVRKRRPFRWGALGSSFGRFSCM